MASRGSSRPRVIGVAIRGALRRTLLWATWGGIGVVFVLILVTPSRALSADPEWVAFGSFVIPGLGQAFNGDFGYGLMHFGTSEFLAFKYIELTEEDDYIEPEDQVDEENKLIHTNRTTFTSDLYLTAWFNLHLYSAYGAYRDARNDQLNEGYLTPAPEETLGDLVTSPFDWELMSRPSTFIPLLLPLYFIYAPPSDDQYLYQPDNTLSRNEMARGFFAQHNMVAVGEEAFFRGILNNGFSDAYGEGWGLALSSALFGVAHQGSAGQATALGAGVFGFYMGYLQQQNDYRIGQGVAIHFWWNFLVSVSMLAKRDTEQEMRIFQFYTKF